MLLLCMTLSVVWIDYKLQPLMKEYGINHANTVCSQAVHQSVEELLKKQESTYSDFVQVEREENGDIKLLEAKSMAINSLQSSITATVLSRLEEQDIQTMSIPFGSITGSSLLSGRGPQIPVKAGVTGTVTTHIKSQFFSAGINQTCHRLQLSLTVNLFVALPESPQTVTLESDFLVTETILPGDVPNLLTNWKGVTN